MRYTIKDKFGNVYKFGKNELIEAARSGKIEPSAIVFDEKYGRSATAEDVPELQDAFEYYAEKKEALAREKELAKNEKAREKAEKEAFAQAQKEETERKRRENEELARIQAREEAERRRAEELAKLEAEERTLAERYGSVEIGKEIQKTKNDACATLSGEFVLLTLGVAVFLFLVGRLFAAALYGSEGELAVSIKATQYGFAGWAIGLPVLWLICYSRLTAKRQAALIRLNELYDESKKIRGAREKDAA